MTRPQSIHHEFDFQVWLYNQAYTSEIKNGDSLQHLNALINQVHLLVLIFYKQTDTGNAVTLCTIM